MSEEDIKFQFITPSIEEAGWEKNQIKLEYSFTDGRVIVRGESVKRGRKKRADYLLSYQNNLPLAIVEAKDNNHSVGDGMQQAINYADILDLPFAYSSNGDGFLEHDLINGTEKEIPLENFPTPEELWNRYKQVNEISTKEEKVITEPYYFQLGEKKPRYYQRIAINRTVEAIAKGKNRILLVMATGTGKTFTAFHIIHKLKNAGIKKRILYLADRNILVDQAMHQEFKPFEKIMTKVSKREMDSSYEIFFSLYQQLADYNGKKAYRDFKPEFFDLIVVDECHRGSAKEDSQWREILEYFHSATQIGMTATPKETKYISNISYFGEPIYTYSLKQGIADGFLAPYKVVRIGLDKDLMGYRPEKGKLDVYGNELEDREYNIKDFDRELIIDDRTKKVAEKVTEFLKKTDRFSKSIIFCVDIEHAERMRQALVNENSDLVAENSKYVMRITGDNKEGKAQLDNFIDAVEKYPTVVTTSKLMSTGVDCKTCKLIVLDNNINSMTEFKQIIGRGTRLRWDDGKKYFTIMDFRNSCRHFADPDFDGEPIIQYDFDGNSPLPKEVTGAGESGASNDGEDETDGKRKKFRVNDVAVEVLSENVQYYDENGKLIVESFTDFSRRNILQEYATLDNFLQNWNKDMKKQAIIKELEEHGVLLEELHKESGYKEMDDFDLICHIAYDKKPLTRAERANNVKKRDYISKYEGLARDVICALLDKYVNDGIVDLESTKILDNTPFINLGSPMKIAKEFGGKTGLLNAIKELQDEIYA